MNLPIFQRSYSGMWPKLRTWQLDVFDCLGIPQLSSPASSLGTRWTDYTYRV